jgi:HEAT repeat protein
MKRKFWRASTASLMVVFLTRCAGGQSVPYSFSSKAIETIPGIVQRASSPDLNDRIAVLDQLVTRDARSHDFHFRYLCDLPREDYLSVARSVLEGELLQIRDRERLGIALLKVRQIAVDFKLSELLPQVAALLEHDDPIVQIFSLMVLEQLGAEKYIGAIAKAASSSNPDVRRPAVEILLKSSSREAVPVLVSCLNDNNFGVQRRAVEALGRIGDRSAVPPLLPLLKTELCTWTIRALVRLDAREAVPYIKELYRPGEVNGNEVLVALAYFGDEEAISQIMAEMIDDDPSRGQTLLDALVRVHACAVTPALISALEKEKALGGQANRGPNIVGYMIISLARLQAQEAIPVLRRYLALADDRDPRGLNAFFACGAIEALGVLKTKEAVPELVQILNFEDYSLRNGAQTALARIGEPNVAGKVITSLKKHMSSSNHVEVLEELANISDPNTYRALAQKQLPVIEDAPAEEYLKQLTEKSGVKFTFSENRPLPEDKRRQGIAALGDSSVLAALRRVIGTLNYSAADYAVFIHDRVIHIVTVGEAYDLWDKWLAEHAKNHAVPAS